MPEWHGGGDGAAGTATPQQRTTLILTAGTVTVANVSTLDFVGGASVTDAGNGVAHVTTAGTAADQWQAGTVTAVGPNLSLTSGTLDGQTQQWTAGSVTSLGAGLSDTLGVLAADWQAGSLTAVGSGLAVNLGTLEATGTSSPQLWSAGTVTDLGAGLDLTSGTLSNSGVLQFGTASGTIHIGAGLLESSGTVENAGIVAIGGSTGSITVGANLTLSSNTLSAAGATGIAQIGTLTGPTIALGSGIAQSGGSLANSGVLQVGTLAGTVGLGAGLSQAGGSLSNSGVVQFGTDTGTIGIGPGLSEASHTLSNTGILALTAGAGISITGTAANETISNSGIVSLVAGSNVTITGGNTIAASAGGGGTSAQVITFGTATIVTNGVTFFQGSPGIVMQSGTPYNFTVMLKRVNSTQVGTAFLDATGKGYVGLTVSANNMDTQVYNTGSTFTNLGTTVLGSVAGGSTADLKFCLEVTPDSAISQNTVVSVIKGVWQPNSGNIFANFAVTLDNGGTFFPCITAPGGTADIKVDGKGTVWSGLFPN